MSNECGRKCTVLGMFFGDQLSEVKMGLRRSGARAVPGRIGSERRFPPAFPAEYSSDERLISLLPAPPGPPRITFPLFSAIGATRFLLALTVSSACLLAVPANSSPHFSFHSFFSESSPSPHSFFVPTWAPGTNSFTSRIARLAPEKITVLARRRVWVTPWIFESRTPPISGLGVKGSELIFLLFWTN